MSEPDAPGDALPPEEPMTVREERLPDGRAIVYFDFGSDDV